MNIETIAVGPFEVNCYVIRANAPDALVIDPGADADRISAFLKSNQLKVKGYLLTHGHVDHISALDELLRMYPAFVAIHPDDGRWAFSPENQLLPYYRSLRNRPAELRQIQDGQEWIDAGMKYLVIATPGHSPGGVCFYFPDDKVLFSGDTLFQGSVGRTDLRAGHSRDLSQSLGKLSRLPADLRVFPGHGPETTLGIEKETNPFLRTTIR